jgi:hypothetical protein
MQTIDIRRDALDTLEVENYLIPLTDVTDLGEAPFTLVLNDVEYTYARSVPVKGHGAVLPQFLDEWYTEGRDVLVARRGERYYVYVTAANAAAAATGS